MDERFERIRDSWIRDSGSVISDDEIDRFNARMSYLWQTRLSLTGWRRSRSATSRTSGHLKPPGRFGRSRRATSSADRSSRKGRAECGGQASRICALLRTASLPRDPRDRPRDRSRALRRADSRSWLRHRRGRRRVGTGERPVPRSTASTSTRGRSRKRTGRTAQFGISGYAGQGDIDRALRFAAGKGHGILAAYSVNEISDETRAASAAASARSARARRTRPRHRADREARARVVAANGQAAIHGSRRPGRRVALPIDLPERQRQLGRAAGLDPRELTARSLWM